MSAIWRGAPGLGVVVSLCLDVSMNTWGPYLFNLPTLHREGHNEAVCPKEVWEARKASGLQGCAHTPRGGCSGTKWLSREKHPRCAGDTSTVTPPPTGYRANKCASIPFSRYNTHKCGLTLRARSLLASLGWRLRKSPHAPFLPAWPMSSVATQTECWRKAHQGHGSE